MPNPMQMIQMLMQRGGKNPQAMAQQILQQNPEFAKAIQGQNPRQLAEQKMKENGMDINQVMSMFGRK